MITARTAFQIYKTEESDGNVFRFNSLPSEALLPYKIRAAEEALLASLAVVEASTEDKAKYAVSTLHAASTYLSLLGSFLPLMTRSPTAQKVVVNNDAIVRTVAAFGQGETEFGGVRQLVQRNEAAEPVTLAVLADLEGAISQLEKIHRQRAKDNGEKIELLRKVAPEALTPDPTPVKVQSPSDTSVDGDEAGDEEPSAAADGVPSPVGSQKRQTRTRSATVTVAAEVVDGQVKVVKLEGDADVGNGVARKTAGDSTAGKVPSLANSTTRRVKKPASQLVFGRLRALTTAEKKAVAVLNQMIHLMAHIYATKYNDLVPIFDYFQERVRHVQDIVDGERAAYEAKEDRKPPEPFHEVALERLKTALENSSHTFREDEECRYELDEDLLHPIAHACLEVVNRIEGFDTTPFPEPTPEERKHKEEARQAAKAKREEAQRRLLERARAKEELANKRAEEKRLLRQQLSGTAAIDEEQLIEDGEVVNPVPTMYVRYPPTLPLDDMECYEKALLVWSMITSVPQPLQLSQMPFSLFLKGMEEEDQDNNGLMEEITRCLIDVAVEYVRTASPTMPRIATRGKNWFDALVEFVAVASGNKKKRQQQQRQRPKPPSDDDDDEDSDDVSGDSEDSDDDDDDDEATSTSSSSSESSSSKAGSRSSSSSRGSGGKEKNEEEATQPLNGATDGVQHAGDADGEGTNAAPVEAAAPAEPELEGFEKELKETLERITKLRSLATWGNLDMVDRLNLLQFCVQEALCCDQVHDEADKLQRELEEDVNTLEKRIKEARDEAEKEAKALLKLYAATTATATSTARRGKRVKKKSEAARGDDAGDGDPQAHGQGDENGDDDGGPDTADDAKGEEGEKTEDAAAAEYAVKKAAIVASVAKKRRDAYAEFFGKQDGRDVGAIIQPLGMDRFRRLYWRFPMDRQVWVQTTTDTTESFPVLPEPEELRPKPQITSGALLLDDEDDIVELGRRGIAARAARRGQEEGARTRPSSTAAAAAAGPENGSGQRVWGVIPTDYLPTFVQGLDTRGEREALLRRTLEELTPYLQAMEEPHEGRVTRARAHTFGYFNKLKVVF